MQTRRTKWRHAITSWEITKLIIMKRFAQIPLQRKDLTKEGTCDGAYWRICLTSSARWARSARSLKPSSWGRITPDPRGQHPAPSTGLILAPTPRLGDEKKHLWLINNNANYAFL